MAELNKGALTSENNNSFPNNNTGYITPTLLRTFNQNMIDSMVDEISYNADSASVSASISQLKNFSSSLDNTYATDAQLSASASTLQNNINSLSASVAATDLAQSSSIAALQVFSSSLDATFATDAQLSASASTLQNEINLKVNTSQTSSMTVLSSSYSVSSSQALNAVTASFLLGTIASASFATNAATASFLLGTIASASYALSSSYSVTSSYAENAGNVDTGSLATTGSNTFNGNQIISGNLNVSGNITLAQGFDLVTHHVQAAGANGVEIQNNSGNTAILVGAGGSLGSTFYGQINTTAISSSGNITGNLIGTASFASNVANVITTGSGATTQSITGSLIISGATFNGKIEAPALATGVTNLDTLFESTASTSASSVVSQIDFTRLGAGPTGDLTGVRLQTFSGSSDTTGDRVLSRISTGVNRHVTLGLSGSVVNTQLTSTWGTGSTSFTSQISATAQSGAASLLMNVGNAAANYLNGTASLQAGRVNIGALGGTISSTGSLAHSGSVSIQNGVLQINGQSNNSSIFVSGATTTLAGLSGSVLDNLGSIYTASSAIKHVVNLGSSSYASLLAAAQTDANTLYVIGGISDPYVLSSQTASFQQSSSAATTGSNTFKATQIISSSVRGEVKSLSIASNTASLDLSLGNFFTLQLVSGAATHINPTNILPGQTINILVSTTGSGTVTFPTSVDQVSGSSYVPTATTSKDILTLVAFDTSIVYLANVKNLI